jgi:hypothetical protein
MCVSLALIAVETSDFLVQCLSLSADQEIRDSSSYCVPRLGTSVGLHLVATQ